MTPGKARMSLAVALLSAVVCGHQARAAGAAPPIRVSAIRVVSLGKPGFDERGRRTPREPVEVIREARTNRLSHTSKSCAVGVRAA